MACTFACSLAAAQSSQAHLFQGLFRPDGLWGPVQDETDCDDARGRKDFPRASLRLGRRLPSRSPLQDAESETQLASAMLSRGPFVRGASSGMPLAVQRLHF
eukprot:2298722-Rhodomonas_salina.2